MERLCASIPSRPLTALCDLRVDSASLPSPPCRYLTRLALPAVVALSAAGQDLLRWRAPSRSCQWDFAKPMPRASPPRRSPPLIAEKGSWATRQREGPASCEHGRADGLPVASRLARAAAPHSA